MSVITRQTRDDLAVVMAFFGIEPEFNLHLFRYAADQDRGSFSSTMASLAKAIRTDRRYGVGARIRTEVLAAREAGEGST